MDFLYPCLPMVKGGWYYYKAEILAIHLIWRFGDRAQNRQNIFSAYLGHGNLNYVLAFSLTIDTPLTK